METTVRYSGLTTSAGSLLLSPRYLRNRSKVRGIHVFRVASSKDLPQDLDRLDLCCGRDLVDLPPDLSIPERVRKRWGRAGNLPALS